LFYNVFIGMGVSVEKFMNSMGITYNVKPEEKRFNKGSGNWNICVFVHANYNDTTELAIYYCFEKKRNGNTSFEQSNIIKSPGQGIFAYLGENNEVYNYFKDIAKKTAERIFGEDEF
jgi:hypothetical protein